METKWLFKLFLQEYFLHVTYELTPIIIYRMVHTSLLSNSSNFSFFLWFFTFQNFQHGYLPLHYMAAVPDISWRSCLPCFSASWRQASKHIALFSFYFWTFVLGLEQTWSNIFLGWQSPVTVKKLVFCISDTVITSHWLPHHYKV